MRKHPIKIICSFLFWPNKNSMKNKTPRISTKYRRYVLFYFMKQYICYHIFSFFSLLTFEIWKKLTKIINLLMLYTFMKKLKILIQNHPTKNNPYYFYAEIQISIIYLTPNLHKHKKKENTFSSYAVRNSTDIFYVALGKFTWL